MATLTGVAPVLLVRDVVAAANYYRERLGFSYDRFWGHPPNFCMVKRDGLVVMLAQAGPGTQLKPHWRVVSGTWNSYLWTDDADALYAEMKERGATIDYELSDKPYGIREFGVRDLDDHDIGIGQPL